MPLSSKFSSSRIFPPGRPCQCPLGPPEWRSGAGVDFWRVTVSAESATPTRQCLVNGR
jgi:hypothetical protein